jgi:FecR protein
VYKPGFRRPITTLALACALSALPAMADSQVRIVRLSDVQGTVQINKNSGLGFERAFMNLPITQGTQLRTLENGRAEVEFEDGSTLRLVPDTTVVFSRLSSNDASNRISTVNLVEGKAYVNWLGKSGDEFTLNFLGEKVELKEPAHFRVEDSPDTAEFANFRNTVEVAGPSGTLKVEKNKAVTFDATDTQGKLTKDVKADPYDHWDAQSNDYHDQYARNNPSPYGYGVSDLSYYGGYSNVPGYGMLWQPYFAGAAWNPFMDGAWSWYPGMGFMWASAYPWGWMPYYYGNWMYAPGYGWGWQPGTWNTWHGGFHYVGAMAATFHAPVPPTGTVRETVVGRGGAEVTSASATTRVSAGSAGLGILRGSYDNLRGINKQVAKAKSGMVELRTAPQFAATSMRSAPLAMWSSGGMRSGGMSGMGHGGPAAGGHGGGGGVAGGGHAR